MLCEKVLGTLKDEKFRGLPVDYVDIEWYEAFTKIHRKVSSQGEDIGIRLDNDVLQFVRNNTPELQITADGVEAMRIKVTILVIGNVVWAADENGDVIAS